MEYKVIEKKGIKIPFKIIREGNTFDTDKTTLSKSMLKNLLDEGKIVLVNQNPEVVIEAEVKTEPEAKAEVKTEAKTTTKTKK